MGVAAASHYIVNVARMSCPLHQKASVCTLLTMLLLQ